MPDEKNESPEKKDSSDSSSSKPPEAATEEAKAGSQDLSKSVSDYYQARRDGLRDKDTLENLPPQPTFFDSRGEKGGARAVDASRARLDMALATSDVGEKLKNAGSTLGKAFENAATELGKAVDDAGKAIGEGAENLKKGLEKLGEGLDKSYEDLTGDPTPKVERSEAEKEAAREKALDAQRQEEMKNDSGKNEAREKLNKALDAQAPPLSDAEKAAFRKNMEDFEKRAASRGLPPEEVAKTYQEINKILEAKGDKPLTPQLRAQLAEQVMEHAAHPTGINQGQHNTCNVAVVESMVYTKNPSAAAQMMAEIATKGEYTGHDGTHVKLNPINFKPDIEARSNPASAGDRNYASQLFQVTAANLELQKQNPNQEYVQRPEPLSGKTIMLGEQVLDKRTGQVVMDGKNPKDFSVGFSTQRVAETYNAIADKDPKTGKYEHFDVGLACPPFDAGDPKHATKIESNKQLDDKLAELKKDNKLPVAIWVHTAGEPFWSDSGGGAAGGAGGDKGGGHYVTVTDYDPGPPARVAIDNQWGASADHQWKNADGSIDKSKGVSTHDLFIAMHDRGDQLKLVKNDLDLAKKQGFSDTNKELDYSRLQLQEGKITSQEYAQQVAKSLEDAKERWQKEKAANPPTYSKAEHDAVAGKFKQAFITMAPEDRMKVLGSLANSDVVGDADKKVLIEETAVALLQEKADKIAKGKFGTADKTRYEKYNEDLKSILDKLPEASRDEILKNIQNKAPKGAPKL